MSSDDTDRTVLQGGIVVRKLLDNILSRLDFLFRV